MADNKRLQQVYDALKTDGQFSQTKDFATFAKRMNERGYSSMIWRNLKDAGANVGENPWKMRRWLGIQEFAPKPKQQATNQGDNAAQQSSQTTAQKAMALQQQSKQQKQVVNPNNVDYLSRPKATPYVTPKKKEPKGKVSAFVQGLYDQEDMQREQETHQPITYTSKGAFKQMAGNRKNAQQQAMNAAVTQATGEEAARRNQPIVKTETPADDYVVKTEGQLENEVAKSAEGFVNNNMANYISDAVKKEQDASLERAVAAADRVPAAAGLAGGMSLMSKGRSFNEQLDTDAMAKRLVKSVSDNVQTLFSNPEYAKKIEDEAARLGISTDAYIQSIVPSLQEKLASQLTQSEYMKSLPTNTAEYFLETALDANSLGKYIRMAVQTKGQRIAHEQAMAQTREGKNPNYKPGIVTDVAANVLGMSTDPIFRGAAGMGGKASKAAFGNVASKIANSGNIFQKAGYIAGSGVVSGGVTGMFFGAHNAVLENYSTGDDTSLGNTLRLAATGALSEGASWSLMGLMGAPLNVAGRKVGLTGAERTASQYLKAGTAKVSLAAGSTIMEALGMNVGGYAAARIEGQKDADGNPVKLELVNGTLETLPTVIGFRLAHAKDLFSSRKGKDGKKLPWYQSAGLNLHDALLSDETKSASLKFTDDEKQQLFGSGAKLGLTAKGKDIFKFGKETKKFNPEDVEMAEDGSDLLNYYQQMMLDPNVSWDAKNKFSAAVMGVFSNSRPMRDYVTFTVERVGEGEQDLKKYVNEYAKDGTLISKTSYDSNEARGVILYRQNAMYEHNRLYNAWGVAIGKDSEDREMQRQFLLEKGYDVNNNPENTSRNMELIAGMNDKESDLYKEFMGYVRENGTVGKVTKTLAEQFGTKEDAIEKAIFKDPMKRTELENNIAIAYRRALEAEAFPSSKPHEEQSHLQGKDVAEDNNLGTEQPNSQAVIDELNSLKEAEDNLTKAMESNDTFKQIFEDGKKQGMRDADIYAALLQNGVTADEAAPLAEYMNANARVQGMQQATQQKIEQSVSAFVDDWAFKGTYNGEKIDGKNVIRVQDEYGRVLIVANGDMAFDETNGKAKEGVGDLLICYDENNKQTVYAKVEDVTLFSNEDAEAYKAKEIERLQNINSVPYNEAARAQAEADAAKAQQEGSGEGKSQGQGEGGKGDNVVKPEPKEKIITHVDPSGYNNATHNPIITLEGGEQGASDSGENPPAEEPKKEPMKFKDGTDVPMKQDSKGRPAPDYDKMTPTQSAEVLHSQFKGSAEKVADARIKKAKEAVKKAEKIKVNYDAEDDADILEQETAKAEAIKAAQENLEKAEAIKKALTALQVDETLHPKNEGEGGAEDGENPPSQANVASPEAAAKFQNTKRLQGYKRRRTLKDGTKVYGHYEIVPAEILTPSHDVFNGYKMSAGFPVDKNGHTINDRDYEHDKDAQNDTDLMARTYDGQAIDHVPTVSDEGIVYDGNGRTMAGQKAAKEGTDADYIEALMENAESFGFTKEQIEQSGIEHPRLVMVTDERLPYDTATFAKFNQNERKTQNNTEKAVAKAKTLTSDEIGAIVAEVEGTGSLEAFFNNPKAINDLIKTLQDKKVLGHNEVAELLESEGTLSAQGKEYVKNLLLGSVFSPETIRMMGIDSKIKTKAVHGIRAIMDNMKLGEYSLRGEIDNAIKLFYEARNNGMTVDDLLRQSSMFDENARDRFSPIEQAIAQAFEGNDALFRDLMREYNDVAKARNTGEGDMFGGNLAPDELVKQFLEVSKTIKENDIKLYGNETERRNSEQEGGNHAASNEESAEEARGAAGAETEPQQQVDEAVKSIATEITKGTGLEVVTGEEAQEALDEAEEWDDKNIKYQTSGEIDKQYPNWLDGTTNDNGKHSTQVAGTIGTYKKVAAWVERHLGKDVKILDASSGMGLGTKEFREQGFNIEDVEPYQSEDRKKNNPATYSSYGDIKGKYDVIISNAVLNVIPDDWRTNVLHDMANRLSDGGRLFINTRKAGEEKSIKDKIELDSPQEVLVKRNGKIASYQRFFTPKELKDWVEKELGDGYEVEVANEKNSGTKGLAAVVVTKKKSPETVAPLSKDNVKASVVSGDSVAKVQKNLDETKSYYEKSPNKTRGFITDISKSLGLTQHEASQYGTFVTKDGKRFTLRISNHNTRATTFDENGENEGVSIVISRGRNNGIRDKENTRAHVVEFFYPKKAIERAEGKPLVSIIESIKETLDTGIYKDKTGLAKPDEVVGTTRKEFRGKDGEVYGFTDGEKIYLDTKKMKPETPLHEYTHLWTEALKRANPKEWENVKKIFDEVEGLKEEVQKLYPELKGDDLYEEMITTYSGREGAKKLETVARELAAKDGKTVTESAKAQGFLDKVKTALQKYWKSVADMLHIHFTTAEEVADKVLADWAKGVNPKDIKEAEKKEESSKDPIEGLKKAAEKYRIEHEEKVSSEQRTRLGIAQEHFDKAKKKGNPEEVTKAAKELKAALDDVMKSEGKPLAQRRKEIAAYVGKEEANIIDKPFKEMDSEEREFVANQKPLTEDEIRNNTSEENKNFIEDAVDYINGKHGFAQKIAYLKIYEDVRNRQENAADNSGAKDGTQLAASDNEGGEGMELGTGRDSRGTAGQLDNGTGGESAPGERGSGESGKDDPTLSAGEQGDKQGEGNTPGLGTVSAGNTDTKGSGAAGTNGTKPKRSGRASGAGPAKPNAKRKPAAKQGTTWKGRSGEEIKKNVADKKAAALAAIAELKKRRGGTLGMNAILTPEQMEYVPTVMNAIKDYGMAVIDQGIYKIKDWFNHIRETFGESLKDCGFSDNDIDEFIVEMWNSKMEMDGETHTIGEWCGIYGNAQLRDKLRTPLKEKRQKQMDAESIEVKVGDRQNIEETLPYLLPQQQDDVLKAETQFFGKEHADRDHAYGKGYMFTNGTGTGKTYTGLGIAKRLAKQGKGRILFVTPSQPKVKDWIKDGRNLGLDIRDLESIAKEKGTTATTESGEGMVITTYANMRQNKKLLETEWDAVIYDESHRIMENKKGAETTGSLQHYMLTNRNENYAFLRLRTINEHYQKMQAAADKFNAQRQKEIERIENEYKQSHPGASDRDLAFGIRGKLPRSLQEFAPSDGSTFPELGKLHQEYLQAFKHYNDVEPKLKEQAKNTWKNTKTIFLSATPFNTRENLDYAEGYIFKYPKDNPNERISPRSRFYMDHFGAAYRFRYNRLEEKKDNPDAIAKQEIAFSDYLQNELGTMSGRIIDSAYDYSRDFPTVAPDHAVEFNNATQEAMRGRYLGDAYHKTIGNYNYGSALFETMKVANIIQRMKDHIAAGRKIVVFHRRVETKEPLQPPFAYMLSYANEMIKNMNPGKERDEAIAEVSEFRRKYAGLLEWEKTLDYSMPREQIAKAFGEDNVLFFSGKESSKVKSKAVDTFNDDNSGKNIIVIQEASGKEGISLHDTTGNHQRVCITLALPQSPITALQIEGRIYRIGNMSNAIFEYPILGLNSEMMLFGEKFNAQVSTTENLALGSQARSLRESFANGVLEHSGIVPIDQQGVGGKEFDAPKDRGDSDPFDDAVLDYYSNQKLNRNNREGIDYFPTPEPLGYKMVEWANMLDGDTALEPSAGHGAIARYVPRSNQLLSIEPSQSLFTKLQLKAGGLGRKFLNNTFENYDVSNKHDVVVMNPPFGTAGATAIAHLDKAFKHLDEGGRVVALIPRGSTDKKFNKWLGEQKNVAMRAEVALPDIVFQQAGTRVVCRVVVLDKITDAAMRAKAGYPEKVDLSGHYDKIEDFFEDLRDVSVPDRIVDNVFKLQKKAKSVKKDIEEIKGVRKVEIDRRGISVKMSAGWKTYTIDFVGADEPNYWREKMANKYKMFGELERETFNEDNKAALSELQKLSCKLAGMSEEEMQRFINKRNDGENGVHFRTQYSETKSKDVKNSRIIPEDVDKNVSSQIEKKFDNTIGEISAHVEDGYENMLSESVRLSVTQYSNLPRTNLENLKSYYEQEISRLRKSNRRGVGQGNSQYGDKGYKSPYIVSNYEACIAAIDRELAYRDTRAKTLRDNYGLRPGNEISLEDIEKLFKRTNRSKETESLYEKTVDIIKRLGVDFNISEESPEKSSGEATIYRDINLFIDGLVKTKSPAGSTAQTILHEMLHQATMGSINLVKKGKANGILTPKQIEAVNTILDIYNKVKDDKERFKENTYGLKSEYELAAQMADPRQRKAMDLSIWDRVVNAAHEFARKGDRTILDRLKDAVKKLFEISDKDKMDKAIKDIIDDFNEKIDDISMNDIEETDFGNSPVSISDDAPAVVKHIDSVSRKTGAKVNIVASAEEVTNKQAKAAIDAGKKVTGWYDEKTGQVHLYMPNIHDSYTAEKTIWHETVGHKGMRELFGDKFDKFLDSVWYDLDKPENVKLKELVMDELKKNPFDYRNAIEEGVARLAEEGKGEPGFWRNIKNKMVDLMYEIGYRIAPNTKDVKYLLWLSKNLQKHPNDVSWRLKADAVKYKLNKENAPEVITRDGIFRDNDGKTHSSDLAEMPKKEYQEATDGQVHFRTAPSLGTAIDRYHRALNAHGYMATESFMDNMLSLDKLMRAIDPSIKKIEDVESSRNPYILQNTMQGAMSNAAEQFEMHVMKPLDKAMADLLGAFDGRKTDDMIRNFNLYMITKHGLERNRVFFVRDYIKGLEEPDAKALQRQWNAEKKDLGDKLNNGSIDLKSYYDEMDEWIRNNVDKDYDASENDYSGLHGVQGIEDSKQPYDDAAAIDSVMSAEAKMEGIKTGSVKDFWSKVRTATDFALGSDYKNGIVSKDNHDNVSAMFDWYIPLRKFDKDTAEDVYGYITEKGDPSTYIGSTLMNAKGRKSLSETNVLAQIGAMGNAAINRGGQNAIKQAFMRFIRANSGNGLVTESKVWAIYDGTDASGNPIWREAYPDIPEDAAPDEIAKIVSDFETDMKAKQAIGDAKVIRNHRDVKFKFERAKDANQHVVDVMVNGSTVRFYVNGNPRAAQALNGMLENQGTIWLKPVASITRTMAQLCTSYSPEFVVRNIVRDAEFAFSNIAAKENSSYRRTWEKYYVGLIGKGIGSISFGDLKGSEGLGLYAKYNNGTLDMSNKVHRYFKEFMENGGETGWVQVLSMKDWEKKYKTDVKTERSKINKGGEMLKDFFLGNLKNINEAAENMARFATYCASRDAGRSAVRSAYDAKEVSTNFNRHGSGDRIWSFKNGQMSSGKAARQKTYGFLASYLRQCSMFFNAGIQSTNLLMKNYKHAAKGAATVMTVIPFAMGIAAALVNNWLVASEDEKERKGVKDPYGDLPEYVRRNNLCIYKGNGEFVTIPLAIELRTFYGVGDLAAGLTFSKNIKTTRPAWADAVGCLSQLVPIMDYTNSHTVDNSPFNETLKAFSPSAFAPLVEWGLNSDWKGAPIRREKTSYNEYAPAWTRAYKNTPKVFMDMNKKANAMTNDLDKGNENLLGWNALDAGTDPSAWNHFLGGFGGGMTTFATRVTKLATSLTDDKKPETSDIPFVRSFLYEPNEQSSIARTKSKWYNYIEDMKKDMSNIQTLKKRTVPVDQLVHNYAAYYKIKKSPKAQMAQVIEQAESQMKQLKQMRDKSSDPAAIDNANKTIDNIMMRAVEQLDQLSSVE